MRDSPTISVFGLGHLGIVQAVCLADEGRNVIGVDRNPDRLEAVARAVPPFVEPELPALLERTVRNGLFQTSASADDAVRNSDISIICVDTPMSAGGEADLTALYDCLDVVAACLSTKRGDHAVVVRSTVPVGTMRQQVLPRLAVGNDGSTSAGVSCLFIPEFLREGNAVQDFLHPRKIVVGRLNEDCLAREVVEGLFGRMSAPRHFVDYELAELLKYTENCWHALKICFANEMGALSSAYGLDGKDLMQLFCQDSLLNLSDAYLKPGMPWGGSCLPKDIASLRRMAVAKAVDAPLIGSLIASNDRHLERCVDRVLATGAERIGVCGLSFKPSTSDLRNSAALALVERLLAENRIVCLHDENIGVQGLVQALEVRHSTWSQAMADGRIRIEGSAAFDDCEVVVLCHGPPVRFTERPGQELVHLYS